MDLLGLSSEGFWGNRFTKIGSKHSEVDLFPVDNDWHGGDCLATSKTPKLDTPTRSKEKLELE